MSPDWSKKSTGTIIRLFNGADEEGQAVGGERQSAAFTVALPEISTTASMPPLRTLTGTLLMLSLISSAALVKMVRRIDPATVVRTEHWE